MKRIEDLAWQYRETHELWIKELQEAFCWFIHEWKTDIALKIQKTLNELQNEDFDRRVPLWHTNRLS